MSTIAELMLKIGADNSGLKSSLKESQNDIKTTFSANPVNEFTNALEGTTSGVGALISKFSSLAALTAGGFGFAALISNAVNAGNSAYEMSQRLGVSSQEAVNLSRVLSMSGTDVGTFNSAIMRLDKSFYATGTSGKLCRDTLTATGVSLTDTNGKMLPLTEQLANMAAGYDKAKQSGQQQAFLMNTLGVKGLQLTKVFEDYNEKMRIASETQGVGLNPKEMHELSLQMDALKMQSSQLGLVFGSALAPVAQELFPPILSGMKSVSLFLAQNKADVIGVTEEVLKLYAAYKLMNFGKSAIGTVQNIAQGFTSNTGEKAAAEELSIAQQKSIERAVKASEAGYARKINAAVKSAQAESASADEAAIKIATAMERIVTESDAASIAIRERMTAAFTGAAVSAEESAVAINTAIASTGTAAVEAAEVKTAATTESAVACTAVVVESSTAQTESIIATGEAAAESAVVKTEATVESAETCTAAVVASSAEQEGSIVAVGVAAEITGAEEVTASESAVIAANEVTVAEEGVTTATELAGEAAVTTGVETVESCEAATTAVGILDSAVMLLQQHWLLVAYAVYEALKYMDKAANSKYKMQGYNKDSNVRRLPSGVEGVPDTWQVQTEDGSWRDYTYDENVRQNKYNNGEDEESVPPPSMSGAGAGIGTLPNAGDYAHVPASHTPHEKKGKSDAEKQLEKEQKEAQKVNDKILKDYQELFYSKTQIAEAGYEKERNELEKTKDVNTAYDDYVDAQGNKQLGAKSQLEAILTEKKRVAAEKQEAIEQGYTDSAIALAEKLADIKAEAIGASAAAQNKQDETDRAAIKAITDDMTKLRHEINETTNLQDRLDKIAAAKKAGNITGDTSSGYVTKANTQPAEDAAINAQQIVNKQKDEDSKYTIWKTKLDEEYDHGHIQKYQQMLDEKHNLDHRYLASQQAYMSEITDLWSKTNHTIYDDTALLMSNVDNDLTSVFEKFAHGTASAIDVFHTFAQSVIDSIIKIQAQAAAASITQSLGGIFGAVTGGGVASSTGAANISPFISLPSTAFTFAGGGLLSGPGTGTSDSILMRGSNGEYMMQESAVHAIGVANMDYMNETGKLPGFATGGLIGGFATGGLVTGPSLSSMSYSGGATAQASGQSVSSGGISVIVNNNGQPVTATAKDNGINSNGLREILIEMVPDAVLSKVTNNRSYANNLRMGLGV